MIDTNDVLEEEDGVVEGRGRVVSSETRNSRDDSDEVGIGSGVKSRIG